MENNQARTLAYSLAKELNVNELDEVAGGIAICMGPTFYSSGGAFGNVDTKLDTKFDN